MKACENCEHWHTKRCRYLVGCATWSSAVERWRSTEEPRTRQRPETVLGIPVVYKERPSGTPLVWELICSDLSPYMR